MNRKTITLLLALLLILPIFTLAGCNTAGSTDQTTAPTKAPAVTTAPTQQVTEKPEEPTPILWYMRGTAQEDLDLVVEALNNYLLDTINVDLDFQIIEGADYKDRMNVMINTGEYYDICFMASWLSFYDYARAGAFYDITDLVSSVTPELYTFIPDFVWEGSKVNGGNYAIPAYKDICCAHFWLLNKEMVEKYDIDYESLDGSLAGMEDTFALMQEKIDAGEEDMVVYPLASSGHRVIPNEYSILVNNVPLGIDAVANESAITCPFENERILDQLRTLHSYYEAGYIPAEAATTTSYDWGDTIQFAICPQGYPGIGTGRDPEVVEIQWSSGWTSTEWLMGSAQAISVNSNYPEKALQFLSLLNLDEFVHNTVVWGVEDVHYTKVSDKHIEQTTDQYKQYNMGAWTIGTFFDTLWTVNDEPEDKWDIVQKWLETDVYPLKINGFLYDSSSVQNEIAAVTNVYAKYSAMLLTGTADPDEMVPEMMDELNGAGLQTIKDDMQTQLDAFMAQ